VAHPVYEADFLVKQDDPENPERTTPINRTSYTFRPSAAYRFTDKITGDAFLEYQHHITRYDASENQEDDQRELIESRLQYQIQIKMVF
jgi:hypothetical protein